MVEEDGAFESDHNGYDWECPCPMGHSCFEDCVQCEDNECGDECVYSEAF